MQRKPWEKKPAGWSALQIFMLVMSAVILPWTLYVVFHSKLSIFNNQISTVSKNLIEQDAVPAHVSTPSKPAVQAVKSTGKPFASYAAIPIVPSLGDAPDHGIQPLYGIKHQGGDAIFALACKYPKLFFQRFVGSLRKFGYDGDIVLAVSPPDQMKPGLGNYLKETKVVAYPFEVDCEGPDNCKLKDEFLGYPDPRPFRTFANIRYALYEYWLRYYSEQSYILILDFRDTFFQGNPFQSWGPVASRVPRYELQVYAENYKVKNIGKCVFNSMWVGRCFSPEALAAIKHLPVICSGSTLGSYPAIRFYVNKMLTSMDTVQCWKKGIESDQGYQNYLFHNGHFNTPEGNATMNAQGHGVVNTIGAMNGYRVPKDQKGPLDTFWKIRDAQGFVLNYDGTRSACVHQWDRFANELTRHVDTNVYDK